MADKTMSVSLTLPTDHGDWIHARGLHRCQSPDVRYGHLAHPEGTPCRADGPNPCLGATESGDSQP